MSLPPLNVKIGADTSGLERNLTRTQRTMRRFALGAAGALAAVGTALAAMTARSMQNIDALTKQARSLGLTTSALQAMSLVAQEAGVSSQKLTASLGLMQRQIIELERGSATATRAFDSLGLSINDLQGLSPDEQFRKIAEALNQVEDPALRTATAMEVFGRSGRDVINMLGDYGAKVDEAKAFQDRFNISVSEIDARNIEAANDAMGRVREAFGGVGNTLASRFAPQVKGASDALLALAGVLVDKATPAEKDFWEETDRVAASAKAADGSVAGLEGAFGKVGAAALKTAGEIAKANKEIDEFFRLAKEGDFLSPEQIEVMSGAAGWRTAAESIAETRARIAALIREPSIKLYDTVVRDAEPGTPRPRRRGVDDFDDLNTPVPSIGGGGAVADQMTGRLEALMAGLQTEDELIAEWYEQGHQTLLDARAQGLLSEQEYMEQREKLEEEHQRRLNGIREAGAMTGLDATKSIFGSLLSAAQSGGDRLIGLQKGISAALAAINVYEGITKALSGKFPANLVAAAQVAAQGFAAISQMQSVSRGSTGSGAATAGGGAASAGATQQFNISFQGEAIRTDVARSGLRELFGMIEEGQRQGFQIRGSVA